MALLGVLAATVGLDRAGWLAGGIAGVTLTGLVARGLARSGAARLGPANRVTLARAVLVCAVTALVADGRPGTGPVVALVLVASVALVLDGVDGPVARRTGTVSAFGGRFDMEVDAFLILVLSVQVARDHGPWVLAIGAARYLLLAAGCLWPWLRVAGPPRYWGKVVAAVQGIVLTVAASGLLPRRTTDLALLASLALLAESFGREVGWKWRRRHALPAKAHPARVVVGHVVALAVVWAALVAPDSVAGAGPGVLLRIPLEGVLLVGLVLVLPVRPARLLAAVAGLALALLTLLRLLDVGFKASLARPFDPLYDWGYAGSATDLLRDSVGGTSANVVLVGVVLLTVVVLVGMPAATLRVTTLVRRHRGPSARAATALGVAWVLSAVVGLQAASTSTAALAYDRVQLVRESYLGQREFIASLTDDPLTTVPADDLLTGLRGRDVLVVFVESYGKVALEDPVVAGHVVPALDRDTAALAAAGFHSRSAFLTSPTYGGLSWLAHSTLQSGLRVDHQRRYDALLASPRMTLASAFRQAGWRTVDVVPSNTRPWPEGERFYGWDRVYAEADLGYAGPSFGYATMPDQFVLDAFGRRELGTGDRPPVMAEIDLVSSHTPWAPLPEAVPWEDLGDGSIFDGMPERGDTVTEVWRDPERVRDAYGRSVAYSLDVLTSFLARSAADPVVVVLGDHQPASVVSGYGASHDVPVSVLARDPAVLRRITPWRWTPGLQPGGRSPVWPMEAFRDRFLAAYGGASGAH
ncbi:MAG: CDP-alcohol phosphatidyltransferase family protein [Nocardioides sp.]